MSVAGWETGDSRFRGIVLRLKHFVQSRFYYETDDVMDRAGQWGTRVTK